MPNFEIIRVDKLKTLACVKRSAQHTFREIPTRNAITENMKLNEFHRAKNADDIYKAVHNRIKQIDNKDKQAVRCLEFFVSASPEQFKAGGNLQDRAAQDQYFADALNWIRDKHGDKNVICHSIHRDEKSPHLVVYAVPVIEVSEKVRKRSVGQKGGGRRTIEEVVPAHSELSCKGYYDEVKALSQLQTDFHAAVDQKYKLDRGISRVESKKHKKPAKWYQEQNAALDERIKEVTALESRVKDLLQKQSDAIAADREAAGRLKSEAETLKIKAQEQKQHLDTLEAGFDIRISQEVNKTLLGEREKLAIGQAKLNEATTAVREMSLKLEAGLIALTPVNRQIVIPIVNKIMERERDMSKLIVGDCVAIFGSKWAKENGITTTEDMAKPAPPEWAKLAKEKVEKKKSQGMAM